MKIAQIEKNNIELLKQYLNQQGYILQDIQLRRLEESKQNCFKITLQEFQDIILKDLQLYMNANKKINQRELVDKILLSIRTSIEEKDIKILKQQQQQSNMQIEDSEDEEFDYNNEYFEVIKFLKIQKEIPGQKTYTQQELFNLIQNYPKDYYDQDIQFDNDIDKQANIKRYENFYQRFQQYFKNQPEFIKEIDEIPNQNIIIICRVIFGKPKNDDQSYLFIEYKTTDGFDYIEPQLNTIDNYLIYPGQMLIVKGSFFMRKFQIDMIINNNNFSKLYIKQIKQTPLQKQCKVMFIKGPLYQKNIVMEKFFDSLQNLLEENFHNLLIVQGPIISYYKKQKYEQIPYQEIRENFLQNLQQRFKKTQILFLEDQDETLILNKIPIPSFKLDKFQKESKKIITLPTPCVLQIGNINIGLFSHKILDQFTKNSLFKTKIENLKQIEILKSLKESQNLHPIYTSEDQIQYSQINQMNIDFPIDIYLLGTDCNQSFAEQIDDSIFLCIKNFIQSTQLGQYGSIILSNKGIHSIRIFDNEQIIKNLI